MNRALLGVPAIAAIAVIAAISPAQGQSITTSGFSVSSGLPNSGYVSPPVEIGPGHFLPIHRRHIRVDDVLASGYGSGGYYDYGDYDANRSFSPDKWNDWWHERPERAYPRWMSRNQGCERPWYSGDVLVC